MTSILILHPGAMGSALAECLIGKGHDVHWVAEGRSVATRDRAEAAGMIGHDSLAPALAAVEAVISICPPDAAVEVGRRTAAAREAAPEVDAPGRPLLYVDANAIAPVTMAAVAATVTSSGCDVVDGGVVGPPPRQAGRTRLYLAGERAPEVADWFGGTFTESLTIGDGVGQASAMKMLYATWTKQSSALLLTIAAGAEAYGVSEALAAEWSRSQPDLAERLDWAVGHGVPKGWRWKGEMEEIAATYAQHGLPAGFSLAAAEIYRRLSDCKDVDPIPPLPEVVRVLLED